MPFTFSHPAAVLPLLRDGRGRGPLIGSAMVAGSLAPDVPFFTDSLVRGTFRYGDVTHSLWGVPTADVAIAAVLVAGWHWLLREPLVALVPGRWADAADTLTAPAGGGADVRTAGWFAVSAAVGAATHVGWDSFTHGGRAGVRLLPVLDRVYHGQPLYSLLQYGCSVLGLGVLAWYVPRALRRAAATTPEAARPATTEAVTTAAPQRGLRLSRRARTAVLALVGCAAAAGAAQRLARWDTASLRSAHLLDLIPTAAFGSGSGAAAGLACYAALTRLPAARRLAGRTAGNP
ncbi:DUF4184 family protein [Streptomyces sp. NPDC051976]|uniref:DUF4184 family protein n=1 Tax=Streptomyces sp. NPDC051976 TaxID=3154947 RepID=UPI00344AC85C